MNKLLYFTATWCNPCKQMKPIITEISEELKNTLSVVMYDIENTQELVQKYNIRSVPTFILINEEEKEISRKVGSASKEVFKDWLNS